MRYVMRVAVLAGAIAALLMSATGAMAATAPGYEEFDDCPGPVRDRLVQDMRDLFDMVATIFRTGISEGQFRADADPDQFAQDFYGVVLARHHTARLLGDERADARAARAFEALLDDARTAPTQD